MTNNADYIAGRRAYARPQGVMWSENPGTLLTTAGGVSMYVPTGFEVGQSAADASNGSNRFLILSDDNRAPIDFSNQRVETRKRMINARMRSYHVADKLTISLSWDMLPSRGFGGPAQFNSTGVSSGTYADYTSDGGAGGAEILDWYENHTGSFYVFLSYDKYKNFGDELTAGTFQNLQKYSQVVEMFFADFTYSVQKRGGSNMDMWNISVTLEEV